MRPQDLYEALRPVLLYEALRPHYYEALRPHYYEALTPHYYEALTPHYYGMLLNNRELFETWRRCRCCTPATPKPQNPIRSNQFE